MTELRSARSALAKRAFGALNAVARPAIRAGLGNPLPIGGGVVVVETIGRTTGQPRPVPLVTLRLGNQVAVSTVRGDSQWFRNLEANPSAVVTLFGRRRAAVADVARGPLSVAILSLD